MSDEFQGLGLVELIELLEEVPEPPPVAMTPQTPGWIVLGVIVAALLFLALRWAVRRHREEAYRRAALRELDEAGDDPAAISNVLRRTALAAYPREQVAGLAGPDWLAFLDRSYEGAGFADGAGKVFAIVPYKAIASDPAAAKLARSWIKGHRRDAVVA